MPWLVFAHPEPPRDRRRIRPVFLPFAGCPHRCLFCDQKAQTGIPAAPLEELHKTLEQGLVTRVRCFTRPDALEPKRLAGLKDLGLDLVELSIQSFDDQALAACRTVRQAGLSLGVQLLPGLPGDRPGVFRGDVEAVARLAPDCARLYPCLVLKGTELAALWRSGGYAP